MMANDVYLYFSNSIGATKASTTTADQLVTVADGAIFPNMPVSEITLADAQGGKGFVHNGMVKLTLNAAHNDGSGDVHLFGSHYGTVADDQANIEVHPNAITYAEGTGDGDFTIRTVDQDAVYGITQSSSSSENGFTLTLLKPYADGQALVKAASTILNIEAFNATNTLITFSPTTGDTGAQDKVVMTHDNNKHHLVVKAIADVITDPRNQGKLIKFADGFNDIYFGDNAGGIASVAFVIDT